MKLKVIFDDGDYLFTDFNGTEAEAVEHYNDNNFLAGCDGENKQVVELRVYKDGAGFPGCRSREIIYNFRFYDSLDCYLF